MDIQRNTKRKTVQWEETPQHKEIVKEIQYNYQNLTNQKKWGLDIQGESNSDDDCQNNKIKNLQQSYCQAQQIPFNQKKSQKTIQIQNNLKKAKLNRLSQQPQQPINLALINRRISQNKQNYCRFERFQAEKMEEQGSESDKDQDYNEKKRMKFQIQRQKYCNQKFPKKF